MNYSLITEDKIKIRMRSLSPDITDLLNSQVATRTVERIGREHSMDEERVEMLQQLVGLVFLGFLSIETLAEEINENLRLNHRHSQEITKDLESRIFKQVNKDLEELYEPLADFRGEAPIDKDGEESSSAKGYGEARPEKKLEVGKDTIYLEKLGPEPVRPPSFVRLGRASAGKETKLPKEHEKRGYGGRPAVFGKKKMDDGGEKPLILHEEKSPAAVGKKSKRPLGSFSFSLGRFFSKGEGEERRETPAPKARVEIPVTTKDAKYKIRDTKYKKEGDKKIVHYSEHRTLSRKSAPKEELMNLSKLRALSPPKEGVGTTATEEGANTKKSPAPKPPANLPTVEKEKKEKRPELEGNTINLR